MQYKLTDLCNPKQWKTLATNELIADGKYLVYGANGIIGKYDDYNHKEKTLMITCRGATCGNVHISEPYSYINGNAMCLDNLDTSKCDIKYLYFYLKNYDMKNVISGSAQPQITINSLNKVMIKVLPLSEQKNIVKLFEKIENGILIKKNEILKLDEIIKSQFVEMFGNKQDGFKYNLIEFNKCTDSMLKGPFGSDIKKSLYVPKSDDTYKVYIQINAIQQDESLGNYYISKEYFDSKMYKFELKPKDYIVTCDGTLGKLLRLDNEMERGIISASLLKITLNNKINYKYFEELWKQYMLGELSHDIRNACLTHLPSAKIIGLLMIPLPPIDIQNKYATIVEQIDKQKFEFEKQLEKLKELQSALMQEYFG